jgi:hypothetical protein
MDFDAKHSTRHTTTVNHDDDPGLRTDGCRDVGRCRDATMGLRSRESDSEHGGDSLLCCLL